MRSPRLRHVWLSLRIRSHSARSFSDVTQNANQKVFGSRWHGTRKACHRFLSSRAEQMPDTANNRRCDGFRPSRGHNSSTMRVVFPKKSPDSRIQPAAEEAAGSYDHQPQIRDLDSVISHVRVHRVWCSAFPRSADSTECKNKSKP